MLLALSSPAWAQQQPTPPEHYTLDARGVDLVTGEFAYQVNDVVIGDPTQGGLVHGRAFVNGGWRDTLSGTIAVSGSVYVVSLGAQSEIFTKSGSTFMPASNRGATLSQSGATLTFTTSEGTVAEYSTVYSGSTTAYAANNAALMSVRRPNGERINFYWDGVSYCSLWDESADPDNPVSVCLQWSNAVRLEGVGNNRGYQINYRYASDVPPATSLDLISNGWLNRVGAIGINLAIDYCSPYDNACTGTRTWPSVSYNAEDFGGAIASVTDQSGRTTQYAYSGASLTGVRLPGSTSDDIAIAYTGSKVSQVTDAAGTWNYAYVDSGTTRTTTATGPLGQSLTAVSDQTIGRATSVKDALNRTTAYAYDGQKRLQRVTQPEGDYAELTYDTHGNITKTTFTPNAAGGAIIETKATYPATCANPVTCNLPTTTTDARDNVTDYTYDSVHGGVLTITAPAPTGGAARPQTRIAYAAQTAQYKNSGGVIVPAATSITLPVSVSACATGSSCVGTADEVKSTLVYGSTGVANNLLPTSTTSGNGAGTLVATSTMTYTPNGDMASVDGPLAGSDDTTTYRYDAARQLVGVISPDPDGAGPLLRRAVRNTYNPRGQITLAEQGTVTGLTDPNWAAFVSLQQQAMTYDAMGRATHQRDQAGGTTHALTQVSYDAAGRADCVAVRMNPLTFASPPGSACTATATGIYGPDRIARYEYTEAAQLKSTISGYGSGAPITESATYTANGLPQTLTDGRNNTSTFEYDGHGRLKKLLYPNPSSSGSSTTDYEEYGYDAASNVTSTRTRANQLFEATYDALNRQTALVAPEGTNGVGYAYDNLGRMTSATVAGTSNTTTQAWDALGRLTYEEGPLGRMSYQYDLAGRRTRQTWPDSFFVTNTWNLTGEMTAILQGGTSQIVGFSYDNLGRRTGITRGNGVTSSYGYDGVNRLTSLSHDVGGTDADVTFGYTYNPASQIVTRMLSNNAYVYGPTAGSMAYANNGLNQVTSVGGSGVGYDANGNITNDATRAFTYDAANRLTGANGGTSTLSYDALGRLDVYVGTYGGRYIYDGAETVGFATSGTTINTRFIRGPGVDEIVANYVSTGPTPAQYWAADERGSLVNLSNGVTGANTIVNTYDEYGVPAPSNLGRLQYTGQLWMPDFGAYHYKARTYQPGLGRFLQTDPIGYQAGANLYAYVGADPVNWVDPYGTSRLPSYRQCTQSEWAKLQQTLGDAAGATIGDCQTSRDTFFTSPGLLDLINGGGGGLYGGMPGGDVGSGPPIQSDPQYAPFQARYQAALERNAIYAEPVLMVMPVGPALRGLRAARGATGLFARVGRAACNCFVEGTEVQTSEGFRSIEQVQVGDLVLARDEYTGETAYKPIVALIAGTEREIWEVMVESTDAQGQVQREPIGTTDEHPWRTADGRWVETKDLAAGAELVSSDGDRTFVVSVFKTDRVEPTYNFEVGGFHTYFVGEAGVWVHNACVDKTITGVFKQLQSHITKLEAFRSNPTVHPAMRGMSQEAIQAQQLRRIELLQGQIRGWEREIIKRMQAW